MDKAVKKKWLEALRSGDYAQAQARLKKQNGSMCCLGVLCDLHAKETGQDWAENSLGESLYLGKDNFLPDEVMKWSGLDHRNPDAGGSMLSDMNDMGRSFDIIADLIDEQL